MKKLFIFILVVVATVYGLMYFSKPKEEMNSTPTTIETIGTQIATTTENVVKGQTYNISIENFAYSQKTIVINRGDTVIWKNIDRVPHDVVGTTFTELKSPIMGYGLTYSFTFNEVGTYDYFCSLHPSMKASVTVK